MPINDEQKKFLNEMTIAATKAGHVHPEAAACEAALESGWGKSLLAIQDHNFFGTKQHRHAVFQTHNLPTREFENGEWITTSAAWVSYPDTISCFADRMTTLSRLSTALPHYKAALYAKTPEEYIQEVSKTWSTDPARAEKCLSIYRQNFVQSEPT